MASSDRPKASTLPASSFKPSSSSASSEDLWYSYLVSVLLSLGGFILAILDVVAIEAEGQWQLLAICAVMNAS
ncbi:hypothetical protein BDZ45DRAFT_675265 [Acephala macrosclerotiorum]|nr:hypothetical protein BDZ45DRAFT_675265 [Acephala macrosclerotiorum]